MGKMTRPRTLDSNQACAKLKNLRVSPQKLNLVAQLIRKQHVSDALLILENCRRRIAKDVERLLISAVSNAEYNHGLDIDDLYVKKIDVGKGLVMKRFHARARGRGAKIMKPFSHLTIILEQAKETV